MTIEELKNLRPSSDASARRIARVYAEALLNAALAQNQADCVADELTSLVVDLFAADPHLEAVLCGGAIGRERRKTTIQNIFRGRASELFLNFLLVLNDHSRLDLVRTILAVVMELQDERYRRVRVILRSAVPLADAQRDRLLNDLRRTLNLEPMLEAHVQPELIGGVIIRVADWLYDGSIRRELEHIRNQIVARSSHEIQSRRDRFSTPIGDQPVSRPA